ncbi:hypothetical protein ACLB2K_020203 [Fragaria x ananassa]
MLTKPILRGRIGKWMFALSEFFLQYTLLRAQIVQAVFDFLLHHHISEDHYFQDLDIGDVFLQPWTLYFDGSSTESLSGAGISLVSPSGGRYSYSFQLEWKCTNNQAEYEDVIIGLEMLLDLGAQDVDILGDSLLVINHLRGKFQCISFTLVPFLERALELLERFATVSLEHIPCERNFAANKLAQIATRVSLADGVRERILKVENTEAKWIMSEVHLGVCRSHQVGPKMRWLIHQHGFYWPTILKDCINFAKGCLECQVHGPIQHIPNIHMQPIIKPWPARGWALDFVGVIHPYASQQHKFILVGTDFFTKWVEAEPVKHASAKTVCQFICWYGILEYLVADMEVSNKIILSILKRMLAENPRDWHNELDNTLWAYRTSKRTPTGTTPYAQMFGRDVVLPLEINVQSLRVRE